MRWCGQWGWKGACRQASSDGGGLLNAQIQTTRFAPIKIRILPSNYAITIYAAAAL